MPNITDILALLDDVGKSDVQKIPTLANLLDLNPDFLDETFDEETSVLHQAVRHCGPAVITWLLLNKPDLIYAKSNTKTNVLFYAAQYANEEAYFYLLNSYPQLARDINNNQQSLCYFACIGGNTNIVNSAFEYHYHELTSQGWFPIHIYVLHYAAENGNAALVRTLLDENPHLDVNLQQQNKYGDTPLMTACRNGHLEVAKLLIESGAEVNAFSKEGWSVLHCAAKGGNAALVRTLLDENPYLNVNPQQQNKYGDTPLMTACRNGHLEVAKLLIERGAEVNAFSKKGWFVLHCAAEGGNAALMRKLLGEDEHSNLDVNLRSQNKYGDTPLMTACRNGHLEVAKLLIERNADVNALSKTGWSVLHCAAKGGNAALVAALVQKLLDENPDLDINLRSQNEYGTTPLMTACRKGHLEVAKVLIAHGADVNAFSKDGWAVLHYAAEGGNAALVRKLFDENPDLDANLQQQNEYGDTPLIIACHNGHLEVAKVLIERGADVNTLSKTGWSVLHCAADGGNAALVRKLFDENPDLDVYLQQQNEYGDTPLMTACRKGHLEVAEVLIAHGADIHAFSKKGWSVLHWAADGGNVALVRMLLDENPDLDINLQQNNGVGDTPLIIACNNGRLNVAALLIEYGADVNAFSKDGWAVLHYAAEYGYAEVVRMLLNKNSDLDVNLQQQNDEGDTPLMTACESGHLEVALILLENGANLNPLIKNPDLINFPPSEKQSIKLFIACIIKALKNRDPNNAVKFLTLTLDRDIESLDEELSRIITTPTYELPESYQLDDTQFKSLLGCLLRVEHPQKFDLLFRIGQLLLESRSTIMYVDERVMPYLAWIFFDAAHVPDCKVPHCEEMQLIILQSLIGNNTVNYSNIEDLMNAHPFKMLEITREMRATLRLLFPGIPTLLTIDKIETGSLSQTKQQHDELLTTLTALQDENKKLKQTLKKQKRQRMSSTKLGIFSNAIEANSGAETKTGYTAPAFNSKTKRRKIEVEDEQLASETKRRKVAVEDEQLASETKRRKVAVEDEQFASETDEQRAVEDEAPACEPATKGH